MISRSFFKPSRQRRVTTHIPRIIATPNEPLLIDRLRRVAVHAGGREVRGIIGAAERQADDVTTVAAVIRPSAWQYRHSGSALRIDSLRRRKARVSFLNATRELYADFARNTFGRSGILYLRFVAPNETAQRRCAWSAR
tara:strand:+ start:503 stop:919 length:417 start_codon:yes stop_codon:yes gene_type:complete